MKDIALSVSVSQCLLERLGECAMSLNLLVKLILIKNLFVSILVKINILRPQGVLGFWGFGVLR